MIDLPLHQLDRIVAQPHTGVRPAYSVASILVKCVGMPFAHS
jgi:hypothetical protein